MHEGPLWCCDVSEWLVWPRGGFATKPTILRGTIVGLTTEATEATEESDRETGQAREPGMAVGKGEEASRHL